MALRDVEVAGDVPVERGVTWCSVSIVYNGIQQYASSVRIVCNGITAECQYSM